MALGVGSILFTGVQTFTNDIDPGSSTVRPEGFSFVTTEPIAAGEVIRFDNADGSNSGFFEFTVGTSGLSALSIVAFSVNLTGPPDTPSIVLDPSGGTVSASVTGNDFSIGANSRIVASSGGEVIAGVGFGTDSWNTDIATTGLSTTNIDAHILGGTSPQAVVTLGDSGADNYLYAGTNLEGISNPTNWANSSAIATDHNTPNISGTTYTTQDTDIACFLAGATVLDLVAVSISGFVVWVQTYSSFTGRDTGLALLVFWGVAIPRCQELEPQAVDELRVDKQKTCNVSNAIEKLS